MDKDTPLEFFQETYEEDNQNKEKFSEKLLDLKDCSYGQQTFNERITEETTKYIVDVYNRLENCNPISKLSKFNAALFERTLGWICLNGPLDMVTETLLYEDYSDQYCGIGIKHIDELVDDFKCCGVNVFYLAQIAAIFDNMEVISHTGSFAVAGKADISKYDDRHLTGCLRNNYFHNSSATQEDFLKFVNYFLTFPEQVNSLFIKADIINFGIYEFNNSVDCEERIIYHPDDEEPEWFYEHDGDCFEYESSSRECVKEIDDCFAFGYVLANPFNMYATLLKTIPRFDSIKKTKKWLKLISQKELGYDYFEHQDNQIAAMDAALKGNTFYDVLLEDSNQGNAKKDFFKKGIYDLRFFIKPLEIDPGEVPF